MKDVTIISKVVGRKEGDRPVTGGGSQAAVDLSAYLLKKTWDTAWELREKDGVPYLFGKLPVVLQSGMTSYVADEAVDLPGIYDGLPIDNQTLKWVETTDENGAVSRVLVAAGGTGGGSVKFPLSWSGFSNGSWDGSEAKTIVIPSKLSDLENDGFFKDYGWTGSDANEQYFGSYLFGGGTDLNVPINSGQLIAYNAKDGGYRGYQMFMHKEYYYYRQHWDNEWKPWRKVISGNVDGVIDSKVVIETSDETAIELKHFSGRKWSNAFLLMNPYMAESHYEQFQIGKEGSPYNCGNIGFQFFGNGSRENLMTIGVHSADNILNVTGWRRVGINISAPRHDLDVNGQIGVTNNIKLYEQKGGGSYEISATRTDWGEAFGFGVTYNDNQLVWKVNREQMDVYGNLIVKGIVDSVTITSIQEQLNGLWKRNWFDDLSATMIMADNASFERLYGDSIIIGDCKLSYDYEKGTLVIQKFDGTDTNVVISGGLTAYSTEV